MLKGATENSKRLIQWLEIGRFLLVGLRTTKCYKRFHANARSGSTGVHDALKNGYLKNLFFGVASDAEGSSLIEVR